MRITIRIDIQIAFFAYWDADPVKASSLPVAYKTLDHLEQIEYHN